MNNPAKVSNIDQITQLIVARPGIRDVEIAEELNLPQECIRPMIHSRITNSRIIVDKVSGMAGCLINAYRINPLWTPEDEAFQPQRNAPVDEDGARESLPVRQTIVPAREAGPLPVAKPKKTRKPHTATTQAPAQSLSTAQLNATLTSAAEMPDVGPGVIVDANTVDAVVTQPRTKRPYVRRQPASTSAPVAPAQGDLFDNEPFVCAVYHDGRGELRAPSGRLVLSAVEVGTVARHFGRAQTPPMIHALGAKAGLADETFVCAVYHNGKGEIRTKTSHLVLTADEVTIVARHFGYGQSTE